MVPASISPSFTSAPILINKDRLEFAYILMEYCNEVERHKIRYDILYLQDRFLKAGTFFKEGRPNVKDEARPVGQFGSPGTKTLVLSVSWDNQMHGIQWKRYVIYKAF